MPSFENFPRVSAQPELSEADKQVMNRRHFLKAAGAAALSAAAPEVLASPEKRGELRLNFPLTPFERESLQKDFDRRAPGGRAEFTLSGPLQEPYSGERLMRIDVIIFLKDGTEKRGKGVGFVGASKNEKMAREALEDAFEER